MIVAQARRAIAEFITPHVTAGRLDDIILCVSEAVSNAVTHGLRESGTVTLAATLEQDALTVVVTDDGAGFRPDSPHAGLGLGLPLIAAVADRSAVTRAASGGTSVTMRFGAP